MKRLRLSLLLMCIACACGGSQAYSNDARVFTVPEVQHILTMLPPEEETCTDIAHRGRRSCFPGDITVPRDVQKNAKGGLHVEGFGLKNRALASHLSDLCSHYLCRLDNACMDRVRNPALFHQECVDYTDCCVAVVDQ